MAHDVLLMTYPAQLWQHDQEGEALRCEQLETLREKWMMLQDIGKAINPNRGGEQSAEFEPNNKKRQRVSQNPESDDDGEITYQEEYYHDLNEYLKIRINKFKGKCGVDIRAYWNGNPTKKGARMNEEDWVNLSNLRPIINK